MKRLSWLSLLILMLSPMTFATSVDAVNSGGIRTGTSAGLSLSGSTLIAIGITGGTRFTGNLGTVSFSTGHQRSPHPGRDLCGGASFVVTGNGTDGIPNGVIFSGSFSGPVTWALINLSNGTHEYQLIGAMSGTWFNGRSVVGATVQLTVNVGKGLFDGSAELSSGDMNFEGKGLTTVTTPEPATLSLISTGLAACGLQRRRKG